MDTPACWLAEVNNLVGANSSLIDAVKQCIIDYTFVTTGENYTGEILNHLNKKGRTD